MIPGKIYEGDSLLAMLFAPTSNGHKPSILDGFALRTRDDSIPFNRGVVQSTGQRQMTEETHMDNISTLRERLGTIDEQVERAHTRKLQEAVAEEERLLRERDRLERRIRLLETYGDDDAWEVGTIFQFTKNFAALPAERPRNSRTGTYAYVVIKCAPDSWYMTGAVHKDAMSWEMLVTFFTNTPAVEPQDVWVVTQLTSFVDPSLDIGHVDEGSDAEPEDALELDDAKVRVVAVDGREVTLMWPTVWATPLPSKTAAGGIRIALL